MSGKSDRDGPQGSGGHAAFTPAVGSFEFTGENANATDRRIACSMMLNNAARRFLRRIGSGHE